MTDGERLRQLFDKLKQDTGMSKRKFAETFKVPGGPSVISQHLGGLRPISLEQAKAYMAGFGCPIDAISPRLAASVSVLNGFWGAPPSAPPSPPAPPPSPAPWHTSGVSDGSPPVTWASIAAAAQKEPKMAYVIAKLRELPPQALDEAIGLVEYVHAKHASKANKAA